MDEIRKLAVDIINEFEDLLDRKGIEIPCDDTQEEYERHNDGNKAKIYGMEYANLEDSIVNLLANSEENDILDEMYDHCYECSGYGDDYSVDEDGEMICNCINCPNNPANYDDY